MCDGDLPLSDEQLIQNAHMAMSEGELMELFSA